MDNIKLLQYCASHPENFLDYNYMFVEKDNRLNSYKKKTVEIKELLTAIKRIRTKKSARRVEEQIFGELQQKLKKYANYSEFGCFINACDSNRTYAFAVILSRRRIISCSESLFYA